MSLLEFRNAATPFYQHRDTLFGTGSSKLNGVRNRLSRTPMPASRDLHTTTMSHAVSKESRCSRRALTVQNHHSYPIIQASSLAHFFVVCPIRRVPLPPRHCRRATLGVPSESSRPK